MREIEGVRKKKEMCCAPLDFFFFSGGNFGGTRTSPSVNKTTISGTSKSRKPEVGLLKRAVRASEYPELASVQSKSVDKSIAFIFFTTFADDDPCAKLKCSRPGLSFGAAVDWAPLYEMAATRMSFELMRAPKASTARIAAAFTQPSNLLFNTSDSDRSNINIISAGPPSVEAPCAAEGGLVATNAIAAAAIVTVLCHRGVRE